MTCLDPIPKTSEHTQTSRVVIPEKSIERPKYIYPSATSPTSRKKIDSFEDKNDEERNISGFEEKKTETIEE